MSQFPSDIGDFVIGESPIGVQPFDWSRTILSQYANSPIILQMIDFFAQNVDPTVNLDIFFDDLWNIQTAKGYGLDVWGRIVGIQRVLPVATLYWGFSQAGSASQVGFDQAPFYSGEPLTPNFPLADNPYRLLILAKAAANIWDGSIPGLNTILRLLFPGKVCYVTDGHDMTMTYTFGWTLSPVEVSIVITSGVLPRPTGVGITIVQP